MALTVEDGTGLAAAASYLSVADYQAAAADLGYDVTGYSDAECEVALRKAFRYINTIGRYKAVKLVSTQRGEFPRDGLVDWSGNAVTGVPADVTDAQVELAFKAHTEDLYTDLDRGGKVAAESVGPVSVSYMADAPVGKTFRAAMQFLAQYLRDPKQSFPPFAGGAAGQVSTVDPETELTPMFQFGAMSNTSD